MKKKFVAFVVLMSMGISLFAGSQAVVFDFGGVMAKEPQKEIVVQFILETFSLSPEEREKVGQQKRLALKAGKTDEEFWIELAKERGITLPPQWKESFHKVMKEAVNIDQKMVSLVQELKKRGIKVGMLSNIDERMGRLIRTWGWYDPFEPCLLSYELGMEKPDLKIYEILIQRVGMPPQEIVFIDDRSENIVAAKEAGIDGILFESEGQLRSELSKRGLLLD